jgi:putative transposase
MLAGPCKVRPRRKPGRQRPRATVSLITDKVIAEMAEWCNRPLESVYPVVFIDAISVKIRDGRVANRPIYVTIGESWFSPAQPLGVR